MNDIKIEKKQVFEVSVDGEKFNVEVSLPVGTMATTSNVGAISQSSNNSKTIPLPLTKPNLEPEFKKGEQGILAPMPGSITDYTKKVGDKVKVGEVVAILEAMKMYNNLYAHCDGVIKEIPFKAGDNVKKYDVLCVIES
jgi:biotin carboxyl carrier protein